MNSENKLHNLITNYKKLEENIRGKINIYYINNTSKEELNSRKEKGVTLVSLVVTIVVLLILAGITIKFALNDNGVIKQSIVASEKYKNSTLKEQVALNEAIKEMQKTSSESGASGGTSDSDAEETIDELNKQIEDLKKQVTDLNGQVNDLNGQISNLTSKQATGNATTAQVLKGATFSNSTGIGLTGTMVSHTAITSAVSVGTDGSKVYLRTSQGAYLTNSTSGYPEISANISDINNATGYKYTQTQYDNNYNAGYNAGKSATSTKTVPVSVSGSINNYGEYSFTVYVNGKSAVSCAGTKPYAAGTSSGISGSGSVSLTF